MSFYSIYKQSNSSFPLFDKMVLECSTHKKRDHRVILDIGLKRTSVCFQKELLTVRPLSELLVQSTNLGLNLNKVRSELNRKLRASRFVDNKHSNTNLVFKDSLTVIGNLNQGTGLSFINQQSNQLDLNLLHSLELRKILQRTTSESFYVRLQNTKGSTEPRLQLPGQLARSVERQFVWLTLFEQLRCSVRPSTTTLRDNLINKEVVTHHPMKYKNIVFGRVVRSLKGGYAVAIPGYIAFLPKSLSRKQFRLGGLFSILKMNAEKRNIVVRQLFISKRSIINALRNPLSSYRWLFPYSVNSRKRVSSVRKFWLSSSLRS
jgi:hypothetical protein